MIIMSCYRRHRPQVCPRCELSTACAVYVYARRRICVALVLLAGVTVPVTAGRPLTCAYQAPPGTAALQPRTRMESCCIPMQRGSAARAAYCGCGTGPRCSSPSTCASRRPLPLLDPPHTNETDSAPRRRRPRALRPLPATPSMSWRRMRLPPCAHVRAWLSVKLAPQAVASQRVGTLLSFAL